MLVVPPPCGYTFHTSLSSTDCNMALVNNLIIHDENKRRKGWGRELYSAWESTLPDFIYTIYLRWASFVYTMNR